MEKKTTQENIEIVKEILKHKGNVLKCGIFFCDKDLKNIVDEKLFYKSHDDIIKLLNETVIVILEESLL
jgi:hypothetical protein